MTNDDRILKIAQEYNSCVSPLLIKIELALGKFPTAILNEIRSLFSHLCKYKIATDEKQKSISVHKAESHFLRIKFDCYKYISSAFEMEYSAFMKTYSHIDISLIDNGEFILKLEKIHDLAREKYSAARESELNMDISTISEKEVFDLYGDAYNSYFEMSNLIKSAKGKADTLVMKEKKTKKREKIYELLTWIFGFATIAGLVLTIIFGTR